MKKNLPEKLQEMLDRFETMQIDHIQAFDTTDVSVDLFAKNFERSHAFENMKIQLTRFSIQCRQANSSTHPRLLQLLQEKLSIIQRREKTLAQCMLRYYDQLKNQRTLMLRGKRALKGYGGSNSPSPRVYDSKG